MISYWSFSYFIDADYVQCIFTMSSFVPISKSTPAYNFGLPLESLLQRSARALHSCSSIDILCVEMLSSPVDVVIRKRSHEEVAVVVVGLQAKLNALVVASLLSCVDKVLRQELLLLVEIVTSTLRFVSMFQRKAGEDTYDINESLEWPLPLLDKLCGVVLLPILLVVADAPKAR